MVVSEIHCQAAHQPKQCLPLRIVEPAGGLAPLDRSTKWCPPRKRGCNDLHGTGGVRPGAQRLLGLRDLIAEPGQLGSDALAVGGDHTIEE
ncbi:MAG: hypothetical protein DI530_17400 [Sphingomonas sp.]|nr:MAG: hypothetical protein DI530_17400 [Sphingomonas sp.]